MGAVRPCRGRASSGSEADLSNLPQIESIDAATDVTAFLRKGIPQELSRAALRRAWSADPAIRDFVGLAENAWDFNDPNAMPGFGALDYSAEQVDALVRRIVGDVVEIAESLPSRSPGCRGPVRIGPCGTGFRATSKSSEGDGTSAARQVRSRGIVVRFCCIATGSCERRDFVSAPHSRRSAAPVDCDQMRIASGYG